MSSIERSALLPYSAEALFGLVNDVEQYPRYLDGCIGAEVLESGADSMLARLDLAKGGARFSLTTRNRLLPFERVDMQLVDGPFQRLQGEWRFHALTKDACKVTLNLQFELANKLLGMAVEKLLNTVASNLVDAMIEQAKDVYGRQ